MDVYSGSAWPNNSYSYYRGLTNLAPAIAVSSNPAAVRALEMLGVERSFQFMQENMHIDLTEELVVGNEVHNDYGTSQLALGGLTTGVSVIDMAAAYSVFPPGRALHRAPDLYPGHLGGGRPGGGPAGQHRRRAGGGRLPGDRVVYQ